MIFPVLEDPEGFIRAHTRITSPAVVPELVLHTADELTPLWHATEVTLGKTGIEPPFWAFHWPGSQALARWLLDTPPAAGHILDVGTGGGLAAIAAARAGAHVVANDIDPLALVATQMNAALNGVSVETRLGDLFAAEPDDRFDLIIVGDLCYERDTSARMMAWLRRAARRCPVIIAEPGRAFAPREGVRAVSRTVVPTTRELESGDSREVVLLAVEAG